MSEPKRCECGQCWFGGGVWWWKDKVCVANSTLPGHCPGSCGCRLSVEAGEPRVGEPYAGMERDAKRFRAVERAMGTPLDSPFNAYLWHYETDGMDTRYDTLGEYADALGGETDTETGEVEVGPSEAKLLVALALELSDHGDCPMDYSDWKCPATPETHDCESGPAELCWLIYYGLATTYADAQALWERMGEAAIAWVPQTMQTTGGD